MPFDPEPPFPPPEPLTTAGLRQGAYNFEDQPTAAYTLQQAADPFALAASQAGDGAMDPGPETTRVAPIPPELLQAATALPPSPAETQRTPMAAVPISSSRITPVSTPALPQPMGNSAVALSEEQHYQEVFRDFVATRERCGEPGDGLTYEKFVQKLRKNREQLVQKYSCKTVRFQVYVKEGKAALKATPVKD
jgi:hypothetical protein